MSSLKLFCALLLASALPLAAQVKIEQRRPAAPSGGVSIDSAFGEVTVRGWEKSEVLVRGELAAGTEGIELDRDEDDVWVSVENPEEWFYLAEDDQELRSRLEVFVPVGSSVSVETVNGVIDVKGVTGEVELDSVNGAIRAQGDMKSVDASSLTGTISIEALACPVSIEGISGSVTVAGASREVEVETVSGTVDVRGRDIEQLDIETVDGDVSFRGSLAESGGFDVETFSGDVNLVFPSSVQAEFELRSFSGSIESELGPKTPTSSRFEPHVRLRFSTGFDQYDVEVNTHAGNITLAVSDD